MLSWQQGLQEFNDFLVDTRTQMRYCKGTEGSDGSVESRAPSESDTTPTPVPGVFPIGGRVVRARGELPPAPAGGFGIVPAPLSPRAPPRHGERSRLQLHFQLGGTENVGC